MKSFRVTARKVVAGESDTVAMHRLHVLRMDNKTCRVEWAGAFDVMPSATTIRAKSDTQRTMMAAAMLQAELSKTGWVIEQIVSEK